MVNGIVGLGCHVFYGCKAVRFVMGNNTKLKYGARLIHSFLGDNSTVSCCEILNNLIFPAHEQHHNNSFLIASLVMGQSNMAAGATHRLEPQQPGQRRRNPGRPRLLAGPVRHAQALLPRSPRSCCWPRATTRPNSTSRCRSPW